MSLPSGSLSICHMDSALVLKTSSWELLSGFVLFNSNLNLTLSLFMDTHEDTNSATTDISLCLPDVWKVSLVMPWLVYSLTLTERHSWQLSVMREKEINLYWKPWRGSHLSSPPLPSSKQAHLFVSNELGGSSTGDSDGGGGGLSLSLCGALIFRESVILREIRINLTLSSSLPLAWSAFAPSLSWPFGTLSHYAIVPCHV